MKTYKHLSLEEREILFCLREQGLSFRKIGEILSRSHTSLSREYSRYTKYGKAYIPCKAHAKSIAIASNQRTKSPLKNHLVFLYVRQRLRDNWSPEAIAGRLSIDHPGYHICTETIYQYIYGKGKVFKLWQYLPKSHRKRRIKSGRKQRLKGRSKIPGAVSIEERSNRVNQRKQIGHWETDLMEGNRASKEVLSVTVERKTRYTLLTKLADKKAQAKSKTMLNNLKMLESLKRTVKPIVRSITANNGSENTNHTMITNNLNTNFYYCHPYASWEKGTVENTIGRIRSFIPKGTSLKPYTNTQIQWLENKINNTPRKCLNYLTPIEALEKEVNKYKFRRYQLQKQINGALRVRM